MQSFRIVNAYQAKHILRNRSINSYVKSNLRNYSQLNNAESTFSRLGRWFSESKKPRFEDYKPKNSGSGGNRPSGGGGGFGGGGGGKGGGFGDGMPNPNFIRDALAATVVAAGCGILFFSLYQEKSTTWQQFKADYLHKGLVKEIVVSGKSITGNLIDGQTSVHFNIGSIENFERQLEEAQKELGIDSRDYIPVTYSSWDSATVMFTLFNLTTIAFMVMLFRASRGAGGVGGPLGRAFQIGKSTHTHIKPGDKTKVTFKDVAGLDEVKVEVMEFVEFLRNPEKFKSLGAKMPKGALLVGPPGTGKTLLAKAIAGEANCHFFSMSGSDFIEMFVGVGPSRVRDLFKEARANLPCIIFIDEIDAVGRKRASGRFSGGHDERESTLNQLLVEMDGFNSSENVVVLAGTNRKDILDQALLRPGRFDRVITVDKPDIRGRSQILKVHLRDVKLGQPVDEVASRVAALTPGMTGADLANICNEAAIVAARKAKPTVTLEDFEQAVDRVIGGLEKKHSVMSPNEKKLVAYHEAGHAVAGWFLEHADPLLKVTIVSRTSGALGFAQYLPKELPLYQQDQLDDMMTMALGGRAAEQIFFGKVSTGASDDLKKVTAVAQAQVTAYGMSPRLGNVSYLQDQAESLTKPFSDKTAQTIDEEVLQLSNKAYQRALKLLTDKKELVEALALKLLEKETISHDILVSVLGPRPFMTDAYRDFLKHQMEDAEKRAAQEKADQEKAAQEKAAQEKAAQEKAAASNAPDNAPKDASQATKDDNSKEQPK